MAFQECLAVRRGPGLGGRHSIGQLRNGRQAMLELGQDHMRAGAEDRAGHMALASNTQNAHAPPMSPLLPADHQIRISPALSG